MSVSIPAKAEQFHRQYPICDMLGINLNHPRFLLDHIDLGVRQDTFRGDFIKFAEWGLSVVMCKGGAGHYDDNYAYFWKDDPTRREGRPNAEPLYLSLAIKNSTQLVLAGLDRFLGDVEAHPDKVDLVRRKGDIAAAKAAGKVALLMGLNRSDWFGDCPGILRMFARLGLRMITIGQSGRELGYDSSDETRSGGRLTKLGVRMIEEMNRAGILIDMAHSNDPCALDIIEISQVPVVDSHSNPRALEPTDRSAPDEVMRALAASGGLLGICPPIERPPAAEPLTGVDPGQLQQTIDYFRYAVDIMGIDAVGIGSHFFSACLPFVCEGLLDAGFGEDEVAKIMGGNYLRVLEQVLPE